MNWSVKLSSAIIISSCLIISLGSGESKPLNAEDMADAQLLHILKELQRFEEDVNSGVIEGRLRFKEANRLAGGLRAIEVGRITVINELSDESLLSISREKLHAIIESDAQLAIERNGALATVTVLRADRRPKTTQSEYILKVEMDIYKGIFLSFIMPP